MFILGEGPAQRRGHPLLCRAAGDDEGRLLRRCKVAEDEGASEAEGVAVAIRPRAMYGLERPLSCLTPTPLKPEAFLSDRSSVRPSASAAASASSAVSGFGGSGPNEPK